MNKLISCLENLIGIIKAHELLCISCDRDGELYCDCLKREVKRVEEILKEFKNEKEKPAQ